MNLKALTRWLELQCENTDLQELGADSLSVAVNPKKKHKAFVFASNGVASQTIEFSTKETISKETFTKRLEDAAQALAA